MRESKQKSALITGGRGFVGRAAAKLIQRAGYEVIVADTVGPDPGGDRAPNEIGLDIADKSRLSSLFEANPISAIVHLAAILPTMAQREPVRATEVNVEGSFHLLEMARRFGVRRFVFGSSLSVYGTYSAERVVSEQDRAAPEDLYGAGKLYVEQLGNGYRRSCGLEFLGLRIGRVVGAGARSATSAWRSEIFEFLGNPNGGTISIPYVASERTLVVHVDDVAEMLRQLLLAEHPSHTVYNAVCETIAIDELKQDVEELNPRVKVTLGNGYATTNPRRLDSSRFQNEFGFRPVPLRDRLRAAAGK